MDRPVAIDADVERLVLDDVHAGRITAYPNDIFVIPDEIPLDRAEAYRATIAGLLARSWVMRAVNPPDSAGKVLLVTTLGDHFRRAMNPDRYRSATAVAVVDASGASKAVAR